MLKVGDKVYFFKADIDGDTGTKLNKEYYFNDNYMQTLYHNAIETLKRYKYEYYKSNNQKEKPAMIKPQNTENKTAYPGYCSPEGRREAYNFLNRSFQPERIIFNPPATIVFWKDGTKTVVKCAENETFNKYHGFCAAVCKKLYNNNSALNKAIDSVPIDKKAEAKMDIQKSAKASEKTGKAAPTKRSTTGMVKGADGVWRKPKKDGKKS